jgi:VanZ family protein
MNKTILTIILILYAALMIVGAVIPNPSSIPLYGDNTKIFHVLGFIVFAFLLFLTFSSYKNKYYYSYAIAVLLVFIYLTELLQLLTKSRHFSVYDMLIDIFGALIGILAYYTYKNLRNKI